MFSFVKVILPLISEIKVDRNKLFSNFKDIRNIGNFQILSCIKLFLNEYNIFKNSSYYMLIFQFSFFLFMIIRKYKNSLLILRRKIARKKK